jgi:transposase InsO family protein
MQCAKIGFTEEEETRFFSKKPEVLALQNRSDSVENTHTVTEKLLKHENGNDNISVETDITGGSGEVDPVVDVETDIPGGSDEVDPVVDVDTTEGWSLEDIRSGQSEDKTLAWIVSAKERGESQPKWDEVADKNACAKHYWAQWERLKLKDGILGRVWESDDGLTTRWQMLVPKRLRKPIFLMLHATPIGGHLGSAKVLPKCRLRYHWFVMSTDIRTWVAQCDICASRKYPPKRNRAKMRQYRVEIPMERIASDILGPLPVTKHENKYILVVADYFTRWTEAYAIPNIESTTVAEKLVTEIICRFGVSRICHSDQGTRYQSELFKETCKLLGIHQTRTTPLHPQSDGLVERFNSTLLNMLSTVVSENQTDWDEYLLFVMMAYRSGVQETTQETPNMMMLGREVKLPVDLFSGSVEEYSSELGDTKSFYAEYLREKMIYAHDKVRDNVVKNSKRQKTNYDVKAKGEAFELGEWVWLLNPKPRKGVSPKLQRDWEGPYLILTKLDDVIYRIQKSPRCKPRVVHFYRLKRYKGVDNVGWFVSDEKSGEKPQIVENELCVNNTDMVEGAPEVSMLPSTSTNVPIYKYNIWTRGQYNQKWKG